jgi:hypothetical protein
MSVERVCPLDVLVAPRDSADHFAQTIAPVFVDRDRYTISPTEGGAILSTIWDRDLDLAAELVSSVFPGEVRWGEPRVRYIYEPRILEPLLRVEVRTPPDTIGNVIGDLMSRRGHMLGMDDGSDVVVVTADVPLEQLFGYRRTLAALTFGKGIASAIFARYEPAPPWFDPNEPAAMALRA